MWRFGPKEDPIFLATTDYPFPQRFDIDTLETMELFAPDNPVGTKSGCTHWMREPDTDNSIYFQMKQGGLLQGDYVEVQRFTPDNLDYSKPEVIATFHPKKASSIHSFSITQNYAIFFYYPVVLKSVTCLMTHGFHVNECIEVLYRTLHFKYFVLVICGLGVNPFPDIGQKITLSISNSQIVIFNIIFTN